MSYMMLQALRTARASGRLEGLAAERISLTAMCMANRFGTSVLSPKNEARLEELRGRARLRASLARHSEYGWVHIGVRSMDCDCAVGTSRHRVEATMEAVEAFVDRLHEDAEGPTSWWFMSSVEYSEFRSERRDLALEAHEDGHPHVVYY